MVSSTASSMDDLSSLGEEASQQQLEEEEELVDLPPPCTAIEIPGIGANIIDEMVNEKERYVSERHEMIAAILQDQSTRSNNPNIPSRDVPSKQQLGDINDEEAPGQAETSSSANSEEDAAPNPDLITTTQATAESTKGTIAIIPGNNESTAPTPTAQAILRDTRPSSGKARRTDALYVPMMEPGAFPVAPTVSLGSAALVPDGDFHTLASIEVDRTGNNLESTRDNANEAEDLEEGGSSSTSTGSLQNSSAYLSVATPVEAVTILQEEEELEQHKAQLEQEIREKILQEAVPAEVTTTTLEDSAANSKRKAVGVVSLVLIIAVMVALALGLGLGLGLPDDNGPTLHSDESVVQATNTAASAPTDTTLVGLSTLDTVQQRGYVRCGVTEFGFIRHDKSNPLHPIMQGYNVEQCKTMALAALGDSSKYEIVFCDHYTRFSYLANRTIDVMTEAATHTIGRDVWVDTFQAGFTFTVPYFYSGLAFAGHDPTFVDCADELDSFYGDCRDLKICVLDGSTHVEILRDIIQGSAIVPYNGTEALMDHLWEGTCNVAAGEPLYLLWVEDLFLDGMVATDPSSQWYLGSKIVSKEPLATVTRHDDPEWSALANMVLKAFILAEANNITRENADQMADLFDPAIMHIISERLDLPSMFVSLIAEFGHYGDLYQGHIEQQIPRGDGLNRPYNKDASTGHLYSIPFGNLLGSGPEPVVNGTLYTIYQRGFLVCGVQPSRGPGFAAEDQESWSGFDVEFCRGLAGSLFAGDKNAVVFIALGSEQEAYAALATRDVDVAAGARVALQPEFYEPTTQQGYSYSPPYYYDNDTHDAFAFMTREDDIQWNSFVYAIVNAVIFAEEAGITGSIAGDMPVVTLFGEGLKQMFRDCILSVGSYAELYNNTLQAYIPRAGANEINDGSGSQMFPIPAV